MAYTTAELCDAHALEEHFQIADPLFRHYGEHIDFYGQINTAKVFEDSFLIETILTERVKDRVLVIDGGGSHRCALIDFDLAKLAVENGWKGLVVYGCIRDSARLEDLPIGIRALHAHPLKCHKRDHGDFDLPISFAGVNFKKDHFLYADSDGIIVSETMLS
ncbi:MAG: ribonuclease E activity regulator RraA [Gammaproteobacteria bacterium]